MIDWLSYRQGVRLSPSALASLNGGNVTSVLPNGEVEWTTVKRLPVVGSYDSRVMIRASDSETLEISGNPSKWFQGHNLFGSGDLPALVAHLTTGLLLSLGVEPLELSARAELYQVDIACMKKFPSNEAARAWLRWADSVASVKNRGRGRLYQASTLYFGAENTRYWKGKIYAKGDEVAARGHKELRTQLMTTATGKLRFEVSLMRRELVRLELANSSDWNETTSEVILKRYLDRVKLPENQPVTDDVLDRVPMRLRGVLDAWMKGKDIRESVSRPTAYRYRSELLRLVDIDIFTACPEPVEPVLEVPARPKFLHPNDMPDWSPSSSDLEVLPLFEPRDWALSRNVH